MNNLESLSNGEVEKIFIKLGVDPRIAQFKDTFDNFIVGQDKAKTQIIETILGSINNIVPTSTPMGVFLFSGPTGVGKTESVKALAKILFGDERAYLHINGEHLTESHTNSNLVGSPRGYVGSDKPPFFSKEIYKPYDKAKKEGVLCPVIRHIDSFNIILVDEIDKVHPTVVQTFLGILDTGRVKLAIGETIDFSHTLFIFTSNMGQREARDIDEKHGIGFLEPDKSGAKEKVMKQELKKFSPEFLGRVHDIINFDALTEDNIREIININVQRINNELLSYQQDAGLPIIKLSLTREVVDWIIKNGYSKTSGARDVARFFKKNVERRLGMLLNNYTELEDFEGYEIGIVGELEDNQVEFSISKDDIKKIIDHTKYGLDGIIPLKRPKGEIS